MSIQNATVRGRRLASGNGRPAGGYYRWHGQPWPTADQPASRRANPSPELKASEAGERQAEFGRLRDAGLSPAEAGVKVGIRPDTARRYEQRRKKALAGGAA